MNRTRSVLDCVFTAVLLCCIVFGITGCFLLAAEMEEVSTIVQGYIIMLVPFAFLCSFLFYSRESTIISVPVMVAFLSLLAGMFRKQLLLTLEIIFLRIAHVVNNYYKLGFTIQQNMQEIYTEEFEEGTVILFLCLIFLFSVDVAGFFYAGRIFVLSSFVLIFAACMGNMPSAFYVFLLLAGLLGLFAAGQKKQSLQKWKIGKYMKVQITCEEEQEAKDTPLHGGHKAAVITAGCFLGTLLIGEVVSSRVGEDLLALHKPVLKWANEVFYNIVEYDYSSMFGNPETKNEGATGRLSNDPVSYTGETVLCVTVEEVPLEAVYLRGFVGKDYRGRYWSEIESEEFDQAAFGWNMGDAKALAKEVGNLTVRKLLENHRRTSELSIEYVAAPGSYAYLPYFAKQDEQLYQNADGIVDRERNRDGSLISVLDTEWFWAIGSQKVVSILEDSGWKDKRAAQLEKSYAEYVKSAYLTVPDTVGRLKEASEESGRRELSGITGYIKRYLSEQAQYSRELEKLPIGKDFTEYFLYEQKKGYCIHFATAAVLMYRMHGIPARFAEGYVVWPEDFVKNEDGTYTAQIPDSRAHAWAEVYYEGFGFVPQDMTPPDVTREGDVEGFDESFEETEAGEKNDELQGTDEIKESYGEAFGIAGDKADESDHSENRKEEKETAGGEKEEEMTEQTGGQNTDREQENGQEEYGNEVKDKETDNSPDENDEQESSGEEEGALDGEADGTEQAGNENSSGQTGTQEESSSQGGQNNSQSTLSEDGKSDHEAINSHKKEHFEAVMRLRFGKLYFLIKLMAVMLPCAAASMLLFLGFHLIYYGVKYRKNMRLLLKDVEDKNCREIIRASCRLHEYLRIVHGKSCKKAGENLSDREYEKIVQAELGFLRKGEYHRFLTLVREAMYCAPHTASISENEAGECTDFTEKVKKYLMKQASWYQRLMMKGIVR